MSFYKIGRIKKISTKQRTRQAKTLRSNFQALRNELHKYFADLRLSLDSQAKNQMLILLAYMIFYADNIIENCCQILNLTQELQTHKQAILIENTLDDLKLEIASIIHNTDALVSYTHGAVDVTGTFQLAKIYSLINTELETLGLLQPSSVTA